VVKQPGQEFSAEELIAFAKDKMTPYKAPSDVKFIEGLPKSLVGKVLKKELRKLV
jgi:long-chain acyl-CoA synthetase